jgi:glycosyltransferase involved in cell wall biosynthesis
VAVASSGLGLIARGIETWAADLAEALRGRGVEASLFQGGGVPVAPYARVLACLPRKDERNTRWAAKVPRGLDWRLALQRGYPLEQTTFAWSLAKVLRRERFDILHVQDPVVAMWMERLRRIGWIRTKTILAHGTEESAEFLRRFEFVQELAPTHLEQSRHAGISRPTWTAIGNFVDTERFRPGKSPELRRELGIRDDAFVVLTLAAIKRGHKRIDWLIEATARLRAEHPEIPLVLVIAGGRENETDTLIAEGNARLGDAVRFLVRYPRERIPDLLRAADVFVLASLFEMMPIALLEAGASGLPCVTHDEATLRWIAGEAGIPIPMDDSGTFGETLYRLWCNPADRQRLAQAGRSHTVETFGAPIVIEQILRYYATVMAVP